MLHSQIRHFVRALRGKKRRRNISLQTSQLRVSSDRNHYEKIFSFLPYKFLILIRSPLPSIQLIFNNLRNEVSFPISPTLQPAIRNQYLQTINCRLNAAGVRFQSEKVVRRERVARKAETVEKKEKEKLIIAQIDYANLHFLGHLVVTPFVVLFPFIKG